MMDTAVIMAAGKGTRFGSLTRDMPKGFIPFKGKPMVERSIENLLACGITRIIIGTGYHKEYYEELAARYPEVETVFSPEYADTNSMETLYRCKEAIGENGFLLLESDIVYERKAIKELIDDAHPNILLVTPVMKFQDQYYIAADPDSHYLEGCSTRKEEILERYGTEPYGELVGIHKISNLFYKRMVEDYAARRDVKKKRGYEFQLEDINGAGAEEEGIFVLRDDDLQWYEIDDLKDLEYAEKNVGIE